MSNDNKPVVLIVEDDWLIATQLTSELEAQGAEVIISTSRADGLTAMKRRPDLAILDVDLEDGPVWPLAACLEEIGVPFVFRTAAPKKASQRFPKRSVFDKLVSGSAILGAAMPPQAAFA